MNKMKIKATVIALLVMLILSMTAYAIQADSQISKTDEKTKNLPSDVQKIVLVHYKKAPATAGGSQGKTKTECYKFLTNSAVKWPSTINYVINPTNSWMIPSSFVVPAITAGANTWDAATSKQLFNAPTISTGAETKYGVQNNVNSVSFGLYAPAGVMAVTTVWYSAKEGRIIEFDMLFDEHWAWGDATLNPSKNDLQNIATHEFGHIIGLSDLTNTVCSTNTMYAYSSIGETYKRTLDTGDIKGLLLLYGQ